MVIEMVPSLLGYFSDAVGVASLRVGVEAGDETRDYLANVLMTFARGEHHAALERSLVLTLDDALSRPGGEQLLGLQTVGDTALYVVSFFPDHLARAQLDSSLYINVGAFAYGRAAAILQARGTHEPRVLIDLEARFPKFVNVLAEVAQSSALGAVTKDLVRLFDRWKSTGSPRALEAMAKAGVFPGRGTGHAC
jgi:hypothetical protein